MILDESSCWEHHAAIPGDEAACLVPPAPMSQLASSSQPLLHIKSVLMLAVHWKWPWLWLSPELGSDLDPGQGTGQSGVTCCQATGSGLFVFNGSFVFCLCFSFLVFRHCFSNVPLLKLYLEGLFSNLALFRLSHIDLLGGWCFIKFLFLACDTFKRVNIRPNWNA